MRAKVRIDQRADGRRDSPSLEDEVRIAISRILAGDHEAYALLVENYQSRLLSLCSSLMRDPAAAEDLAQDAFVRAFEHLHAFDTRRPFYPWLAKISLRLAQNRWHAMQRQPVSLDENDRGHDRADSSPGADPSQAALSADQGRHLWQAVGALTSRERVAVVLFYQQDLGVNEIARILGVTAGTVKTLLFRGRKRLRRVLESHLGDRHRQEDG